MKKIHNNWGCYFTGYCYLGNRFEYPHQNSKCCKIHVSQTKLTLSKVLKAVKLICQKYGFKIIDYGPNGCVGKSADTKEKRYHTYFDIVLYKS